MIDKRYENNLSLTVNKVVDSFDFGIKNSDSVSNIIDLDFEHSDKLIALKITAILGRIKVYSRVTNKLSHHPDFVTVFENFAIMASDRLKTLWLITDQEMYLSQKYADMTGGNVSPEEVYNRVCNCPNITSSSLVI